MILPRISLIGSTTLRTPLKPPRKRSPKPDKPATLTDLSYDYDTEDGGERGYQRDA